MHKFHGFPDSPFAKSIKSKVDSKLIDSFEYLLSISCKGLNISPNSYLQKLTKTRGNKLNSLAYLYHTKLKNSIKEQDTIGVKEILKNLELANFISNNIVVDSIESTTNSVYENQLLLDIFKYGYTTTYKKEPDIKAMNKQQVNFHINTAKKSLEYLKIIDNETYKEIESCVSEIMIYESSFMNSGTSFNSLGLITMNKLINNQNWTTYLEIIVHEAAHIHLYNLMVIDPLFKNKNEKFFSPLRLEKRPMIGIFHGMFVLSRIIRVFFMLDEFFQSNNNKPDIVFSYPEIVFSYNNSKNDSPHIEKFNSLYTTVLENAILTEKGKTILSDCKRMTEKTAYNTV